MASLELLLSGLNAREVRMEWRSESAGGGGRGGCRKPDEINVSDIGWSWSSLERAVLYGRHVPPVPLGHKYTRDSCDSTQHTGGWLRHMGRWKGWTLLLEIKLPDSGRNTAFIGLRPELEHVI